MALLHAVPKAPPDAAGAAKRNVLECEPDLYRWMAGHLLMFNGIPGR
jgi:hypothetical protein